MRYPEAHAATSGSVPFMLRGPKPLRTALAAVAAGAIGLIPAVMVATPAMAATSYSWSPESPAANEGGTITVDLVYTGDAPGNLTWSSGGGTATSGTDYTAVSVAPIAFVNNKATLSIATKTDSSYEGDETVEFQVSNGQNVTATIRDGQTAPVLSVTPLKTKVKEGTDTTLPVTVTLTGATTVTSVVKLKTMDGTGPNGAKQPGDYTAANPTLTFTPGQAQTQTTNLTIEDDQTDEEDQTFTLTVESSTNVSNTVSPITITIEDDDAAPAVEFGTEPVATEGTDLSFSVLLADPSEKTVTVKFDTSDYAAGSQPANEGVATAGKDYTAVTGKTVTFEPNDQAETVVIPTSTDDLDEVNPEDLKATLSGASNASLGSPVTATGRINDPSNATAPTPTLSEKTFDEGNGGWAPRTFTVKLDKPSGKSHTLTWAAATNMSATTADFKTATGELVFAAGEVEKTFTVSINGDRMHEGDETFTITLGNKPNLGSLTGGDIVGSTTITLKNDDSKPTFTVNDVSRDEGNEASVGLYTVTLSNPSSVDLEFGVLEQDGTAMHEALGATGTDFGKDDYALPFNNLSIPSGYTKAYTFALINGDAIYEGDESASLKFTPDSNALLWLTTASATAGLTLKNDDKRPELEIQSVNGKEGDMVAVEGKIWGQSQDDVTFNVWFKGESYKGSTAATVDDFENPGILQEVVYKGAESGSSIEFGKVKLNTDTYVEPSETVLVEGTALSNGGTVKPGWITIAASGTKPDEPGEAPKPTLKAKWAKLDGAGKAEVEGYAAPMKEVNLWGQEVGGGSLKWIKKVTSDDDGYFWFDHYIDQGFKFQVESQYKKSDEVYVWVTEKPYFVVSTSGKGQLNFGVKGYPWWEGQTAAVQEWTKSGWKTIRSGKIGKDGVYRSSYGYKSGSKVTVRGWVEGNAGKGIYPAFSEQQTATVK